jgi:hypothetical protein
VCKGNNPRRGLLIAGLLFNLAVPSFAESRSAELIDSGAAPVLWHILAVSAVMAIFQWRRLAAWLRDSAGLRSPRSLGYVFAASYVLCSTPLALNLVDGQPLPRFNDVFLVGIVLTCYFFTWEPAAVLLVGSVLISAWVLPPSGTLRVVGFSEWYRLTSFTLVSIIVILVITRMKTRRPVAAMSERLMGMRTASSGD